MSYTWESLAVLTGAEMVGGDLQLMRGIGDYLVLGRMANNVFTITPEGMAYAQAIEAAAAEAETPAPKARGKKVELTVDDTVTTSDTSGI